MGTPAHPPGLCCSPCSPRELCLHILWHLSLLLTLFQPKSAPPTNPGALFGKAASNSRNGGFSLPLGANPIIPWELRWLERPLLSCQTGVGEVRPGSHWSTQV